jgi:hypothetical protein
MTVFDENSELNNDQINDLIRSITMAVGVTSDGKKLIDSEEVSMFKALLKMQVEKTGIEFRGYKYRTPAEVEDFDKKYGDPE